MSKIQVIDSHTGGEPTRIIVSGGPDLGAGSIVDRLARFRDSFDEIRSAVVNEPRGSDVMVGGIICEPSDPKFAAGVIFFNNAGYLGMCGHGTIGLMVTLRHLGRIELGRHLLETPVGPVQAELSDDNTVTLESVASYRLQANVEVDVPGYGTVVGDVAWGGNWFFLVKQAPEEFTPEVLNVGNATYLTQLTLRIRQALDQNGIVGTDGPIDHVELFGPPLDDQNDSRNFVLCPGGAYDRSPCGTGTSAKLACLAEDGKLAPGEDWRQESVLGSVFIGSFQPALESKGVIPTISGSAFICGESNLILDPNDPFCMGIRV
ncbi:MAG: 4-hydroxyproline epimerase [Mariniblastus sp.]|jgi:4-hydroxyproline epimerase